MTNTTFNMTAEEKLAIEAMAKSGMFDSIANEPRIKDFIETAKAWKDMPEDEVRKNVENYFVTYSFTKDEAAKAMFLYVVETGIKIEPSSLKAYQSQSHSNATVEPETDWTSGYNMFIAGTVIGAGIDQLVNGFNATSPAMAVAMVAGGYFLRNRINNLTDGNVKKGAMVVASAATVVAGSMGVRKVKSMFSADEDVETTEVIYNEPVTASTEVAYY